jgi:HEAT repeat protein
LSLAHLLDALPADLHKVAVAAASKAAGTAVAELGKKVTFTHFAQNEILGAFVSALATAAERSRSSVGPDAQLRWWSQHADGFFAPFENKNLAAVVSKCAIVGDKFSEISDLLQDALVLCDIDPEKFGEAHEIDFRYFCDILPALIIDAIIYTGSQPSSKLANQALLAQVTKFATQLCGVTVPRFSPQQVRDEVAHWCTREAMRHRESLRKLPYLIGHPDPTALDVDATTRVGLRRTTEDWANVYLPPAVRFSPGSAHTMPYATVVANNQQIVVLGDPGVGKSWVTHMHAIRLAEDAARKIADPEVHPDDVIIPIAMRCDALAAVDGDLPEAAAKALAQLDSGMTLALRHWLEERCRNGRVTFLFDALDETPDSARDNLNARMDSQLNQDATTIVTCRISGYGTGILDPLQRVEVELLPFDDPTPYIESWHLPQEREHELKQRVGSSPLSEMARIPLMLALLCNLASDPVEHLPRTRARLYGRIMRRFLRREQAPGTAAKAADLPHDPQERERLVLGILRPLAYNIATSPDGWLDRIPDTTLQAHLESIGLPEGMTPASALRILSTVAGILVPDGDARKGRNPPYLFVHRTFAEYLVAEHLQMHRELIEYCLEEHLFLDPDWREVWILLTGLVPEVTLPKLVNLESDPLHTALRTATAAVEEFDKETLDSVADDVDLLAEKAAQLLTRRSAHAVVRQTAIETLGCVGGPTAVEALVKAITDSATSENVRGEAALWLSFLNDEAAVEALLRLLKDSTLDEETRSSIAFVLAGRGHAFGIEWLQQVFLDPNTDESRRAMTGSLLGQVAAAAPFMQEVLTDNGANPEARYLSAIYISDKRNPTIFRSLLGILTDGDAETRLRIEAARSLGRAGERAAVKPLSELLASSDTDSEVRATAARALGFIGDLDARDALRQVLNETEVVNGANTKLRGVAANALGRIGDREAVPLLCTLLQEVDPDVREGASEALGALGDAAAVDPLCEVLGDSRGEPRVRRAAAESLGKLRDPSAVEPLCLVLRDGEADVILRSFVASALSKFDDSMVVGELRTVATDARAPLQVRRIAAAALPKQGGPGSLALRSIIDELPADPFLWVVVVESFADFGGDSFSSWLAERTAPYRTELIEPVFNHFRKHRSPRKLRRSLTRVLAEITIAADGEPPE